MKGQFEAAIQGSLAGLAAALQAESQRANSGQRQMAPRPVWKFTRPTLQHTQVALGRDVEKLPAGLRRALQCGAKAFSPVPLPKGNDWLAEHEERGQSFQSFTTRSIQVMPRRGVDTMHLVPIGDFDPERSPSLDALRSFSEAFFGCKVEFLEGVPEVAVSQRRRDLGFGQPQLHTHEIREYLVKMKKPKSSFCQVGITMRDLYTSKDGVDWNFVYGQASLTEGTGIFSFARYRPGGMAQQEGLDEAGRALLLKRSCKVLAHEATHILGLKHCIHYHCLMNGANHLEEFDAAPMFLCPVCLRKFQHATKCDPVKRYRALKSWYDQHGFCTESEWVHGRLSEI